LTVPLAATSEPEVFVLADRALNKVVAQITGLSVETIHRGQQDLAAALVTRPTNRSIAQPPQTNQGCG